MPPANFAKTPKPPYYAAILSAQRTEGDHGHDATAARMHELVEQQPGFLGAESTGGNDGFGITVAYFDSEESIRRWHQQMEHTAAREKGRTTWYSHYEVRVARVERAYNFTAPETK
jgi:heme-degrading monooxygenase HmoA